MQFSTKIINWYHKNKRELPWRQEVNPYLIWLSEVILQQTRVNQGLPYYLKFVSHYPTIAHLANASEAEVLKDWQGLGYYSRARNLHAAAKTMVKRHGGKFPRTYEEILALEGIGPYTAAAIASFAFGLPYPVIDGNVQRVIARIFGIQQPVNGTQGRKEVELALNEVFDKKKPADFNQAIMEFGALLCKPQQPLCNSCPFEAGCYAKQHNLVQVLPAKEKKAKVKIRYFLYLVPQKGKHEFIVKRTENDIWKNLYEFPLIEMEESLILPNEKTIRSLLKKKNWGNDFQIQHISSEYKHVLTHRIIYARFVLLRLGSSFQTEKHWVKKLIDNHEVFAFPVLMQNYLNER